MTAGPLQEVIEKAEIRKSFERFDLNGDGWIDREEMEKVIRKVDAEKTWSDAEISQIFSFVDLNGDGRIHYREFVEWVYSSGIATSLVLRSRAKAYHFVRVHCIEDALKGGRDPHSAVT